jgi:hypothetical protein
MRTARLHRLIGTLAGLLLLLAVGAPAVLAKEGVEVTLAAPISSDAKPGDIVPVFFRLSSISDTGTAPLGGSDVFIRLFGPRSATTQAPGVEQRERGLYKAMIEIPAGGAARAEFGIHGSSTDASGKTVPSDIIWEYDGILVSAVAPAPVKPHVDPATGAGTTPPVQPAPAAGTVPSATSQPTPASVSLDPRLALGAVVVVGLGIAGALAVSRRRRIHSPA